MELSVVVPCYNEEEALPETASRLSRVIEDLIAADEIGHGSRIYFVDDGSRDGTWKLIESLAASSQYIKGIKLSRNRGHQLALLAGLTTVPGDAIVSVDADLQDDVGAIEEMVRAHKNGSEIVYGVRARRTADTLFKRFTAEGYYRLLDWLGVEVVFNHADFRLLGRRALDALAQYRESNVFLRGLIPQLGYPSSIVTYDRQERFAGKSKYPLRKMFSLAWDGVTSFSPAPLRFITALGFSVAVVSLAITVWAISIRLFTTRAVPGWASTVVPIFFLGGIQLLSIGMIGEYVAKAYLESKLRPRYFIEKVV